MPPSECVCVLFSGSSPRAIGHHTATNVELSLTTPLKGSASPVGDSWVFPLLSLKARPSVTFGTPSELSDYAAFVARAIRNSREALQRDHPNCESLSAALGRAEQEASLGRASSARDTAVGLIGYAQLAQLAEQLAIDSRTANNRAGMKSNSCGQPDSSSSSTQCASSAAAQFKVPALPTRRQNSPGTVQQPQPQQQQQPQPAAELQQQQRRHGAPKRRATPQVWDHGPICITPAAPPNSSMHGEACCDATLLPCWCPLSGKRLKADPQPEAAGAAAAVSTAALQQHLEACDASQAAANVSNSSMPRASSSLARSSSTSGLQEQQQQQEGAAKAVLGPGLPLGRAAFSSARRDAIEDLQRSMHQDPSSKPAADVLLFHKATQLPVVSWTGPIKHKASGQVVEICSLTLQVPEAFLEEFPGALYAAELRHRKTVSLGRHVVCRASLSALSEHQLASLATMARAQLVAVCMLQTAELHIVPYHDNKNHVRCVGFLKAKSP